MVGQTFQEVEEKGRVVDVRQKQGGTVDQDYSRLLDRGSQQLGDEAFHCVELRVAFQGCVFLAGLEQEVPGQGGGGFVVQVVAELGNQGDIVEQRQIGAQGHFRRHQRGGRLLGE